MFWALEMLMKTYFYTACPDGFSYNISYGGLAPLDKSGVRCRMPGLPHGHRKDCDFS